MYTNKELLGPLSFWSLQGGRPGVFIAPFLLFHGLDEKAIGMAMFTAGMVKAACSPPIGFLIDKSSNKKMLVGLGNLIVAIISMIAALSSVSLGGACVLLSLLGIGESISFPALYGITLGIIETTEIEKIVASNEAANHAGNLMFALSAAFFACILGWGGVVLFIVALMGFVTIYWLTLLRDEDISYEKSMGGVMTRGTDLTEETGIEKTNDTAISPQQKPVDSLLQNPQLLLFFITVFLFHFGNAAMLPILSQWLTINTKEDQGSGELGLDNGIALTSVAIIIAQLCMYFSARETPVRVMKGWGLSLARCMTLACSLIPLRAAIICSMLAMPTSRGHPPLLLLTQVLDGAAGGMLGVCVVLASARLASGTGRFSFIVSAVKTLETLGGAFSCLVGEGIAKTNYLEAFLVLGVIGCSAALLSLWLFLEEPFTPITMLKEQWRSTQLRPGTAGIREGPTYNPLAKDEELR